jgi:outer membrane protein assembly factor BamA
VAANEPVYEIVEARIEGANKTHREWAFEFLQLKTPVPLSETDVISLQNKLMTTNVFTSVDYSLEESKTHPGGHVVTFKITEKWTTIPVIRGAMGGGTPLRVFGIYDTHVWGRLWTLGAETRKYGTAANGYIVWARAPRWQDGRSFISTELWSMPRVRYIFDEDDEISGNLNTGVQFFRFSHLRPFNRLDSITRRGDWKYGFSIDLKHNRADKLTNLSPNFSLPQIQISKESVDELHLKPIIEYDNIIQSNLYMNGIKLTAGAGTILSEASYENISDFELFAFKPIWKKLYSAFHLKVESTDSLHSNNISYLGGLDSVRGYPDGVMLGKHAAYTNFELRLPGIKTKNIHTQNILFVDSGSAAFDWSELTEKRRTSVGMGIRIGTPHVYRLVLRIDYAWSLNSNNQGLSIGLNQFFQPYKPL